MFFRSRWEANYALYLDFMKKRGEIRDWRFESDTFMFDAIVTGTRSYTPDFKVFNSDGGVEYHEVKGWFTPRSRTQIKRMAKYHPHIKLVVIDRRGYADLEKKLGPVLKFFTA